MNNITNNITRIYNYSNDVSLDYDDFVDDIEDDFFTKREINDKLDDLSINDEYSYQLKMRDKEIELAKYQMDLNFSKKGSVEECDILCQMKNEFSFQLEIEKFKQQQCLLYPSLCKTIEEEEEKVEDDSITKEEIVNIIDSKLGNNNSSKPWGIKEIIIILGVGLIVFFGYNMYNQKKEEDAKKLIKDFDDKGRSISEEERIAKENLANSSSQNVR